jgi:uncharacterized protein (DUF924 family)
MVYFMWSAEEIIIYWFGRHAPGSIPSREIRNRWFLADKKFDREIRRRFMTLLTMAAEGGLDYWLPSPQGYLAIILILDQFTRHIYRNTPFAFDFDRQARKVCNQGLGLGADVLLQPVQRAFFYMPLKHSERIADQKVSLALHQQLLASTEAGKEREIISGFVSIAEDYYQTIKRFNRFPQRNKILKRGCREEELEFLAERANSFRA